MKKFLYSFQVLELLSPLTNIKNEQQKYPSLLEQAHISLFYTIQSAVRSNNCNGAPCKHSFFSNESISSSCSQIDVEKENAESPRTGKRIPVSYLKMSNSCINQSKKYLLLKSTEKLMFVTQCKNLYFLTCF